MEHNEGALASYYAALFNAITQAGAEIGDDVLTACNDELEGSGWDLELDSGLWQAKEAGE